MRVFDLPGLPHPRHTDALRRHVRVSLAIGIAITHECNAFVYSVHARQAIDTHSLYTMRNLSMCASDSRVVTRVMHAIRVLLAAQLHFTLTGRRKRMPAYPACRTSGLRALRSWVPFSIYFAMRGR